MASAFRRLAALRGKALLLVLPAAFAALSLSLAGSAGADTVSISPTSSAGMWETDGSVNAVAVSGSTAYIGGQFSYVGPRSGHVALFENGSATPADFPHVNGYVAAAVSDGSGGWYIGGSFSVVGGVYLHNAAHVLSDGSVDPDWAPNPNNEVDAIAKGGSSVYIGGWFQSVNGDSSVQNIAKLDGASATPDVAFDAQASVDGTVQALAFNGTNLFVAGDFSNVGVATDNPSGFSYLVKLTSNGDPVVQWSLNAQPNGEIDALALSSDNSQLYVGGGFDTIGNDSNASNIARLYAGSATASCTGTPTTGGCADTTWDLQATANGNVSSLALAGDESSLYVGGDFDQIGGDSASQYLAKLSTTTGTADSAWDTAVSPDDDVLGLAVSGSTVYATGYFDEVGASSGNETTRKHLAAFDASTGVPTSWAPLANAEGNVIVSSGTSLLVGGSFDSAGGVNRSNIAAIDLATGAATAWDPGADNAVNALATSGSWVYAGGDFSSVDGSPVNRIAKLAASNGAVDTDFAASANNTVSTLLLAGSTLYAGGHFTSIGSDTNAKSIAKLDASTGAADTAWDTAASSTYPVTALAYNGTNLYLGLTSTFGFGVPNVIKLTTAGNAVSQWTNNAGTVGFSTNSGVTALLLSSDKTQLYVGGSFTSLAGDSNAKYLGRLYAGGATASCASNATTGGCPDTAWNAANAADAAVLSFVNTGTAIFAGGNFSTVGTNDAGAIAQFDESGNLVTDWNPSVAGFMSASVNALATTSDGELIAGGNFAGIGVDSVQGLALFPLVTTTEDPTTDPTPATGATETPTRAPEGVTNVSQNGSTTSATAPAGIAGSLPVSTPSGTMGSSAPKISWGTTTFPGTVKVTAQTVDQTGSALGGFGIGSIAIVLNITENGTALHTFASPIELQFPNAPANFAPAYSEDNGTTWTAIPLISGTTLPAGNRDGYYRDAAGTVHILTLHATDFGLVAKFALKTGNRPTYNVGAKKAFVFLAPERAATATVTLRNAARKVLRTIHVKLPAATTRLAIPLPQGLKAGKYTVKVVASAAPTQTIATLGFRLVAAKHAHSS